MMLRWSLRVSCIQTLYFVVAAAAVPQLVTETAAQETNELPPVVVEGATLAVPPIKTTKGASANETAPSDTGTGTTVGAGEAQQSGTTVGQQSSGGNGPGIPLDELGAAVSVVTGDQLRAQQVRYVADALRSLPGVEVSRTGGDGNLTQVRIRGFDAQHTLVLIDGVEANDTSNGQFDFSDLSADDIERIEVIRGPMSGLYGSGASGGVINIITKDGRGPLTFSGHVEGGSFVTHEEGGRVSAGNSQGYFSLGYYNHQTDGFPLAPQGQESDGSTLSTFNFKAGLSVVPGVALDFVVRNSLNRGDYDDFGGNPGLLATAVDAPNKFDHDIWLTSGKLTFGLLDGALTNVISATNNSTNRVDSAPSSGTSQNDEDRAQFAYAATYRFNTPGLAANHAFTALIEHQNDAFTPLSNFGFGIAADGVERDRPLNAGAFEYHGGFVDRLFFTGQIRQDDYYSTFGDFTTWRTGVSVNLAEIGLRPHASYGTGIKVPSMFEEFGSIPAEFRPNPTLLPEESKGWDAGVETTFLNRTALIDITYFDADLTNKINGFTNFDPVSGTFTAINLLGLSTRKGIEVSSKYKLSNSLIVGLDYTFLDARDPNGTEEIRRPPNTARADLTYLFNGGRGTLNLSAIYNGDATDNAFEQAAPFDTVTVALPAYWLVNAAATYKVEPGVEIYGRINNLLDQQYQEVFGYNEAGIAAFAGVRFKYEEPASVEWAKR
jgi:vitamin B12 transporter